MAELRFTVKKKNQKPKTVLSDNRLLINRGRSCFLEETVGFAAQVETTHQPDLENLWIWRQRRQKGREVELKTEGLIWNGWPSYSRRLGSITVSQALSHTQNKNNQCSLLNKVNVMSEIWTLNSEILFCSLLHSPARMGYALESLGGTVKNADCSTRHQVFGLEGLGWGSWT